MSNTVRRLAVSGLVVVVAAFIGAAVITRPASAHGSTIDPMSRNYGCWKRWGSDFQNPTMATTDPMCWQAWQDNSNAMWNWNGLYREGTGGAHQQFIADGQLCSGGLAEGGRYRSMDTPGNWQATNLSTSFTVRMHDQARHGADYLLVYVTRQGYNPLTQPLRWADLELRTQAGPFAPGAGQAETDPVLNGVTISASATAPGRSGRHIVYTIWKASHADQIYYFCADVNFGGTSTTPPTTTRPPATTTPPVTSRPPTTTTTRPTTTSSTGPPTGSRACTAVYTPMGQWPGGFQAEVQVAAGSQPITAWTVTWTFPNGQQVQNSWNATIGPNGAGVAASNVGYNGSLAAGASTTFGFLGSWSGTNSPPTNLSCTAS